jgi:WXG100 family type VII secretion target
MRAALYGTGQRVNDSGFPADHACKPSRPVTGRHGRQPVTNRERTPTVANLNVTYADLQSAAGQLRSGEQQINGDLARLKKLIDNLVASGYVTDSSSKQFQASYEQFNSGATKMIAGLAGMGQYLDAAAKAFHETDTQLAAALKH